MAFLNKLQVDSPKPETGLKKGFTNVGVTAGKLICFRIFRRSLILRRILTFNIMLRIQLLSQPTPSHPRIVSH
jgi:hypothetical protein